MELVLSKTFACERVVGTLISARQPKRVASSADLRFKVRGFSLSRARNRGPQEQVRATILVGAPGDSRTGMAREPVARTAGFAVRVTSVCPVEIRLDRSAIAKNEPQTATAAVCATLFEAKEKLWEYNSPTGAGKFLAEWCRQTMRSHIEPMKKIARSLRQHRELILNYFRAQKLISSGVVEGLNNKAKVTMRKSYGFRTYRVLELALYHSLGKLPEPESTHEFF